MMRREREPYRAPQEPHREEPYRAPYEPEMPYPQVPYPEMTNPMMPNPMMPNPMMPNPMMPYYNMPNEMPNMDPMMDPMMYWCMMNCMRNNRYPTMGEMEENYPMTPYNPTMPYMIMPCRPPMPIRGIEDRMPPANPMYPRR